VAQCSRVGVPVLYPWCALQVLGKLQELLGCTVDVPCTCDKDSAQSGGVPPVSLWRDLQVLEELQEFLGCTFRVPLVYPVNAPAAQCSRWQYACGVPVPVPCRCWRSSRSFWVRP